MKKLQPLITIPLGLAVLGGLIILFWRLSDRGDNLGSAKDGTIRISESLALKLSAPHPPESDLAGLARGLSLVVTYNDHAETIALGDSFGLAVPSVKTQDGDYWPSEARVSDSSTEDRLSIDYVMGYKTAGLKHEAVDPQLVEPLGVVTVALERASARSLQVWVDWKQLEITPLRVTLMNEQPLPQFKSLYSPLGRHSLDEIENEITLEDGWIQMESPDYSNLLLRITASAELMVGWRRNAWVGSWLKIPGDAQTATYAMTLTRREDRVHTWNGVGTPGSWMPLPLNQGWSPQLLLASAVDGASRWYPQDASQKPLADSSLARFVTKPSERDFVLWHGDGQPVVSDEPGGEGLEPVAGGEMVGAVSGWLWLQTPQGLRWTNPQSDVSIDAEIAKADSILSVWPSNLGTGVVLQSGETYHGYFFSNENVTHRAFDIPLRGLTQADWNGDAEPELMLLSADTRPVLDYRIEPEASAPGWPITLSEEARGAATWVRGSPNGEPVSWLAITEREDRISFYEASGDRAFELDLPFQVAGATQLALVDLDGDGLIEVMVANNSQLRLLQSAFWFPEVAN